MGKQVIDNAIMAYAQQTIEKCMRLYGVERTEEKIKAIYANSPKTRMFMLYVYGAVVRKERLF